MAISPLWPKPPRWPIQPGAVDPNQRWVWHTRPRFILPLWEHASAGAAQRYVRLAQTRRTARTWQLNTGAAAMRTPWGPGVMCGRPRGRKEISLVLARASGAVMCRGPPSQVASAGLAPAAFQGGTLVLQVSPANLTSGGDLIPTIVPHAGRESSKRATPLCVDGGQVPCRTTAALPWLDEPELLKQLRRNRAIPLRMRAS